MAGTTIYTTLADILDAAQEYLHVAGLTVYRTLMIRWANEIQLEIQKRLKYEALRTSGTITLSGDGTVYEYSFPTGGYAIDLDSVRDKNRPLIRKDQRYIFMVDPDWNETGTVDYFVLRPQGKIWLWRIPTAAYIASNPTVYLDYFTRFNAFTAETDPLTQYYENHRGVLIKGLKWLGGEEGDDSRADRWKKEFEEAVMEMGSIDGDQGADDFSQVGLGPWFDDPIEAVLW